MSGLLVGRVRRPMHAGRPGLSSVGGVVLIVAAATEPGPLGIALGFLVVASYGSIAPNAVALAIADQPHQAGSASALIGACQFLIGACAAPLVSIGGTGTAPRWPWSSGPGWLALGTFLVLHRPVRPQAASACNHRAVCPGALPDARRTTAARGRVGVSPRWTWPPGTALPGTALPHTALPGRSSGAADDLRHHDRCGAVGHISDIVEPISELSKRIEMIALAPSWVACSTRRDTAWLRVSSRSFGYSVMLGHRRQPEPTAMLGPMPRLRTTSPKAAGPT